MLTEMIPWHRLVTQYIPLDASRDRRQIELEHGSQAETVGKPTQRDGHVLERMRINGNPQDALLILDGRDSP